MQLRVAFDSPGHDDVNETVSCERQAMTGPDRSTSTAGGTAASAGEPRRRPGGRSARVRAAVLEATLDQLAESGYDGLSFEAVAVRAGVHKTTLYRRWSDRTDLVLDAMLELSSQTVPVPDFGSVRADLLAIARGIAGNLSSPRVLG